ncbi:MAG: mannose-1-phosphate guanylyltransferase/mannose-6-phosphate isomerase [Shimia sp.]|uniref:mannose-1-phosphate guanylyltransferase/mannose-6-phosphate isomerase n=1 Tax=Shimia sp. TaxID=1954381 RepID=UPI0040590C0E
MLYPTLLAGGSGTRLWPVSRKSYPKQFADLVGDSTLFQQTLARFSGTEFAAPIVVTGEDYRFIAKEQMGAIGVSDDTLIIEPAPRNSAPAVLVAALSLEAVPEAMMLVSPCDHAIADAAALKQAIVQAKEAAQSGAIVVFGITPDHPATGYGYLDVDAENCLASGPLFVHDFVEKPNEGRAAELIATGHLWNSGMFVFRVDTILEAFHTHAPEMVDACRAALVLGVEDLDFLRLNANAFKLCDTISFDHAIMEKLDSCAAISLDCGWSDLGGWNAIAEVSDTDENGNALIGNATSVDCAGSVLKSNNPDIALVGLGLENIIAVATDDGVLVADKSRSDDVGTVVKTLRDNGADQGESFRRCHRPWGYYETLSLGSRFQVKRIMVKPGAQLSLQSHVHRAEHWVVVEGSANVTVGDTVSLLTENQSTYIPLGAIHRLENPGKLPLHLIEVQSGCYLGEDDIQRYEDIYDRVGDSADVA